MTEFLSAQLLISCFTDSLVFVRLNVYVLLQEHWTRPTFAQHTCVIRQEDTSLTAELSVSKGHSDVKQSLQEVVSSLVLMTHLVFPY